MIHGQVAEGLGDHTLAEGLGDHTLAEGLGDHTLAEEQSQSGVELERKKIQIL